MRKEKSFTLLNMVRTVSFLKFDRVALKYPFDAINNCVLLHSMSLASSYHVSDSPCITIHTYLLPYIFRLYACPYQKVKNCLIINIKVMCQYYTLIHLSFTHPFKNNVSLTVLPNIKEQRNSKIKNKNN